ncbi:hypothetical protein GEMRC1_000235 [Eukaryota sp. GEM-RC1]
MDIANVTVVDINNDVRINQARERFAVYQDHQQSPEESLEALLFAVQRNLPEAHLPAATLLLDQQQPDRRLGMKHLSRAVFQADDNTVCQFFRESVLLDRCEELCSFPTYPCDKRTLIRNCDDPLTQCYFFLFIIAHFPYFVRDTETATQFLRRIRQLLPVLVEFPEMNAVSFPSKSAVYYKAEKSFTSLVNHRIQVLRDRGIPTYGEQVMFDGTVWLVLLCECCHSITKAVPKTLREIRDVINQQLGQHRPPNYHNLRNLFIQSSIRTSFRNIIQFLSEILPEHPTVKYIMGKCIANPFNGLRLCRTAAKHGCPFALITKNDDFVVIPKNGQRCAHNIFEVAEFFFQRKMFMEAFLFVFEGRVYLNELDPVRRTSCIDLLMKVYLFVGRFDLARELAAQSTTETASDVVFLMEATPYFQTVDFFLWFNIYRPYGPANVNRYLKEKAQELHPDRFPSYLHLLQQKNNVRLKQWNNWNDRHAEFINSQVVNVDQILDISDVILNIDSLLSELFRCRLLATISNSPDPNVINRYAEIQLKGDGFIRDSLSVIENDHVREDLGIQAQNNVGRLYVDRPSTPIVPDPPIVPDVIDSNSDADPPFTNIVDIDLVLNSPIPRHSLLRRLFCCCGV